LIFSFAIQFANAQKLYVGPRIGANISQISGLQYSLPRAGWDLGAFIVYKPCPYTGFSADLLLSSTGSRAKHAQQSGGMKESWDSYINMNYLKLPLLYNVYFSSNEHIFRPKLFAGFVPGILLSSKQSLVYSMEDNGTHIDSSSDKNTCSQFKKIDLGAVAGAGFVFKMAENASLNLDVRYQYGFQDIRSDRSIYSNSLHHNSLSVLFGIAYFCR
jgi:hypothetical protein